jgi:hypothetical protein
MVSLNATAAALLRAICTTLQRTSPGAGPDAQLGAVSFLHGFGSALNPLQRTLQRSPNAACADHKPFLLRLNWR